MTKEVITFLLANPAYLAGLISIALLLLLLVVIVGGVAFFQGREVAFGPIKFGAAPKKDADPSKSPLQSRQLLGASGVRTDYANAHQSDAQAISSTKQTFEFLGISSQFLYAREGFLNFAQRRALTFRFCLLSPTSSFAKQLEEMEGLPVRHNIVTSARNLLDLKRKNPNISIRFYNRPPKIRIIITDRILAFISYYGATRNNPNVELTGTKEGTSFLNPCLSYFDEVWAQATECTDQTLDDLVGLLRAGGVLESTSSGHLAGLLPLPNSVGGEKRQRT
jgi:hypothetical protein